MSSHLPLDQMTIEEKLEAMEALWQDLTRGEETFESPSWHALVLRIREERIRTGAETFIDWERAKQMLRETFDEDSDPHISDK
jgi:hypothetical protein